MMTWLRMLFARCKTCGHHKNVHWHAYSSETWCTYAEYGDAMHPAKITKRCDCKEFTQ